jgi:DNA polymerase-3 subunit delta
MFILLHGSDDFSAGEELDRLRAAGGYEHNQAVFAGGETDLATIRNTGDTMPFLSERRLIVMRGLPKRRRGSGDEDEGAGEENAAPARPARGKKSRANAGESPQAFAAGLAEYAARLPETTDLVVLVDELLEPAHPLVRAAHAHGRAQMFATPVGAQLEGWMARRAQSCGVRLAPDAARLLLEAIGENLRLLANEIEKLATYVGADGTIRAEDVHALTATVRELRAFDLTDALLRRDRAGALALLHELLAQGSAPLQIVGMVAYQTRTLMQVKSLAERGQRPPQIAQASGIAPFVAEKSLGLARRFSMAQLEASHRALLEVDTILKRSRMTSEMALDLLVLSFGDTRD